MPPKTPAITKVTRPDELLFRFDPDADKPTIRGAHYCDRTSYLENGERTQSVQNPAQAVSTAKGVAGLDLTAILGTVAEGLQNQAEKLAADLKEATEARISEGDAFRALVAAKDANIQTLLETLAARDTRVAELLAPVQDAAP